MIGIYKLTNKLDGKIYIGQSTNIEHRLQSHRREASYLRRNYYLYNSIALYGWDSFSIEILVEVTEDEWTAQLLDFYETYFVFYYNSMASSGLGYNIRFPGSKGAISEETRLKLSIAHLGKPSPFKGRDKPEYRGAKHPMYGKHHTEEAKQKISKAQLGRIVSDETKRKMRKPRSPQYTKGGSHLARKVRCIETNQIFDCILDAKKFYGITSAHIGCACQGKYKTCGGFHWEYVS